ncbi:hypothetical protein ACIRST_36970 [Kitasatospora sp. NPDC101447]|uniref:hypothetical protein n=1 Tax=Kitasatospora sp. NPDC101447 TaxID=3364102 RepID=UPI0037FAE5ED
MSEQTEGAGAPPEWCVVANVAATTTHGPDGAQVRSGLRHFAPGARLWVSPPRYPDEDGDVHVVGLHRGGGRRHISVIIRRRHLEGFRVRRLHEPAVRRARWRSPYWNLDRVWCCPDLARPWVERWNAVAAGLPVGEHPPWPSRFGDGPLAEPCPHGAGAG